jgi:hypothetical protein
MFPYLFNRKLGKINFIYIHRRGHPNNIIHRAKHCTGAHTYTTTRRNETVNFNLKIKHTFIGLILRTKSVFKHLKEVVHNIQI